MKTLTNLTATAADAPATPLTNVRAALYHELSPAFFVHISLSAEGVRVWRGSDAVVLPLAEIERLAAPFFKAKG